MSVIEFFVPVQVVPKQSATFSRINTYTDPKVKMNQGLMAAYAWSYVPKPPWDGPIRLSLIFHYAWLKRHKQAVRDAGRLWKTTIPDNTNLLKQVEDVLSMMRFFVNDKQVASTLVDKIFTDRTGVLIRLEQLEQEKQPCTE